MDFGSEPFITFFGFPGILAEISLDADPGAFVHELRTELSQGSESHAFEPVRDGLALAVHLTELMVCQVEIHHAGAGFAGPKFRIISQPTDQCYCVNHCKLLLFKARHLFGVSQVELFQPSLLGVNRAFLAAIPVNDLLATAAFSVCAAVMPV